MSYHLFVDDERFPTDVTWIAMQNVQWAIVRNYDQFVVHITEHGVPHLISFDHDLGDFGGPVMINNDDHRGRHGVSFDCPKERTGFDCAKWLVQHCIDTNTQFPEYQVHSMNPIGRKRIRDYIEWAKEKMGI